jgi:hypothetical protein
MTFVFVSVRLWNMYIDNKSKPKKVYPNFTNPNTLFAFGTSVGNVT